MRLLIVSLHNSPEPVGIGRYTGEMASWLAGRGHQVHIISAPPYYPQWNIQQPFRNRYVRSTRPFAGTGCLSVQRCPLLVPGHPTTLSRLLLLASFALTSTLPLLAELLRPPDRLVVIAPAFFCTPPALLFTTLCRLRGKSVPAQLHVQDFELDVAFELGLLRGGPLRSVAEWIERFVLSGFQIVSSISPEMCKQLDAKGVAPDRIVLFPNWVDCASVEPILSPAQTAWRVQLGFPPDAVVALYSGSMNRKQGLEVLSAAASQLVDHPTLHWIFCGAGPTRAGFEAACTSLPNVRFLPLQPPDRFSALLQLADIHLLPQRAGAADLVMPSKLLAMLASGRPVVATAETHTGLATAIVGDDPCGLVTPPGDPYALAKAVQTLAENPDLRAAMGASARNRALMHWDRDAVLTKFEHQLMLLGMSGNQVRS